MLLRAKLSSKSFSRKENIFEFLFFVFVVFETSPIVVTSTFEFFFGNYVDAEK